MLQPPAAVASSRLVLTSWIMPQASKEPHIEILGDGMFTLVRSEHHLAPILH